MHNDDVVFLYLDTQEEIEPYRDQWNALAIRSAQGSPMLSYDWFFGLSIDYVSAQDSWGCFIGLHDGRVVAVLPLIFADRSPRQLRTAAASPYNSHQNISDLIADTTFSILDMRDLFQFVFIRFPKLRYVDLPRICSSSAIKSVFPDADAEYPILGLRQSVGYYLPLPENLEQCKDRFSRNLKKNLQKSKNKIKRLTDVQFEIPGPDANVVECLQRFCKIEQASWKGKAGTAIGDSEKLFSCYVNTLERLDSLRIVEWSFLTCSEGDIAGQMLFRVGDRLVLWKLGYDDTYAYCSPGNLLLLHLIETEIDHGTVEIDLTSDQHWYESWGMITRTYHHVRIYNKSHFHGFARWALDRLRRSVRNSWLFRKVYPVFRR